MTPDNYLNAGQLVHFTSGEYSDYQIKDTFLALRDLSTADAKSLVDGIRAHAKAEEEKVGWYGGEPQEEFLSALLRDGYLLSIICTEKHLGSYGELEVCFLTTTTPNES